MKKSIFTAIAILAVATVATVIVAQEMAEDSVVKVMALTGRDDLRKAVTKADADYFKRISPSEGRLGLVRYRAIAITCKKTITALERVAANAKRTGADLEAAIAKNKIATAKEYLAKAEANMPKNAIPVKPPPRVRVVKTFGARSRLGRKSYLVILRRVTWDQARRMAEAHGGRLASVDSVRKLVLLRNLARTDAWVGGAPGGDPVQWQWADGKKIVDALWVKGSPAVNPGHRVCVSTIGLGTGKAAATKDAFVVEWGR